MSLSNKNISVGEVQKWCAHLYDINEGKDHSNLKLLKPDASISTHPISGFMPVSGGSLKNDLERVDALRRELVEIEDSIHYLLDNRKIEEVPL